MLTTDQGNCSRWHFEQHSGGQYLLKLSESLTSVVYLGDNNYNGMCTSDNPCDVGVGDCDDDAGCMDGLICGQRDNFEQLAGLIGLEEGDPVSLNTADYNGKGDYCYDPNYDPSSFEYKWGLSIHDSSDLELSFGPDKSLASVHKHHKDLIKHSIWSLVENEHCKYFEPVTYTPPIKV